MARHGFNQPVDGCCRQQRRGATTEVDGFYSRIPADKVIRLQRNLPAQGIHQVVAVFQRSTEVEVAVVACLLAKRHMEVNTSHADCYFCASRYATNEAS